MIEIDTTNEHPRAWLDINTRAVRIEHLTMADPDVHQAAHHWAVQQTGAGSADLDRIDLTQFVESHLALGVKVAALGTDTRGLVGMQQAMGSATERTERIVADAAERTTQASALASKQLDDVSCTAAKTIAEAADWSKKQLDETTRKISEELAKLVDGDDNPVVTAAKSAITKSLAEVQSDIETRTKRSMEDISRKFDMRDPTSPVGQLHVAFRNEQEKIAEDHRRSTHETTAKLDDIKVVLVQMGEAKMSAKKSASVTPIKGRDHESKLHEVLEAISADHGDGYVRTGATTGALGSSKKGDGVVTMHDVAGSSDGIASMVVEMHNSDTMVRDWSEYLDVAIRNRKAQVALGIVRTQDQLPGGDALRMWGCRKIVVAFDPDTNDPALLRAVYLLLRAQACLSAARNGIDQVQTAEEQLRAAAEQLTQFAELQKMVVTIKTNADKTVLKLGGLQETLARHVTAALAALREAGGSEATSAAA